MPERFVKLPDSVLNDERLSCNAKVAYAVLVDTNFDGVSRIGFDRLGERLGHLSCATAKRAVKELHDYEYVTHDRKGRYANEYQLRRLTGDTTNALDGSPVSSRRLTGDTSRRLTDDTLSRPSLLDELPKLAARKRKNDDEGIKEGDDQAKLRGEADAYLRAMGIDASSRQKFLANVDLVIRWKEVDWPRDYPGVHTPSEFLAKRLRKGDEPEFKAPQPREIAKTADQLQPKALAIATAAWEAMRSRCPQTFERFISDGWAALETLSGQTTGEEVTRLLRYADSFDCRNTPYELMRSLQYLERNWNGLKRHYTEAQFSRPLKPADLQGATHASAAV